MYFTQAALHLVGGQAVEDPARAVPHAATHRPRLRAQHRHLPRHTQRPQGSYPRSRDQISIKSSLTGV